MHVYLLAAVLFTGCSGGETAAPADTDKKPVATTDPATTTPPPFDPNANADENLSLVPSPIETQSALESAGIDAKLADFIVERPFDAKNTDQDNVAVRTGVVIADLLLTVKNVPKDKLLTQIQTIYDGMSALNGGQDILSMLADMKDQVQADSVSRDQLLKDLDEMSGAVIPELKFNGNERIVPLVQAGSWLEGANLVAKAVKKAGKFDAADALLKQPAVVDYFIKYVSTEGKEKAPAAITDKLLESLNTLKGLANKQEPFTEADIDLVIKTTDDVIALL